MSTTATAISPLEDSLSSCSSAVRYAATRIEDYLAGRFTPRGCQSRHERKEERPASRPHGTPATAALGEQGRILAASMPLYRAAQTLGCSMPTLRKAMRMQAPSFSSPCEPISS